MLGLLLLVSFIACSSVSFAEEIIAKESASGSRNMRPFTVQDGWEIRWDSTDHLSIWLNDPKEPAHRSGEPTKAGSGRSYQAKGGTYFLSVIGGSSTWTITVVQLP
jgi:hypothetical protein